MNLVPEALTNTGAQVIDDDEVGGGEFVTDIVVATARAGDIAKAQAKGRVANFILDEETGSMTRSCHTIGCPFYRIQLFGHQVKHDVNHCTVGQPRSIEDTAKKIPMPADANLVHGHSEMAF